LSLLVSCLNFFYLNVLELQKISMCIPWLKAAETSQRIHPQWWRILQEPWKFFETRASNRWSLRRGGWEALQRKLDAVVVLAPFPSGKAALWAPYHSALTATKIWKQAIIIISL